MRILAPLALALAVSTAGCLGWLFGADEEPTRKEEVVEPGTPTVALDFASDIFKNYTFPGQATLPWVAVWYNDTVGVETNLAVESVRDDGGNDFNAVVKTTDVSAYLPPGQPAEIAIRLFWNAAEGKSADIDILVDVPGTVTTFYPTSEEFNINIPTRTMTVNTVGVAGYPAKIGVQAANGRTTSDLEFHLEMKFSYPKDVLTPYHPYAFRVPQGASGLILESVKAAGDEHVSANFVILDPDDNPLLYMEYDDLAIPTESVFIPLAGPGEYVFYAYAMRGGFLSAKADVALGEDAAVRILETKEERVVDLAAPAPGVVGRNWLAPNDLPGTPRSGGQVVDANLQAFPLEIVPFVDASGSGGFTGMAQIAIESPKGLVAEYTRIARLDTERGTLGYTDDEDQNLVWNPANLAKGPYKITIVNNSNAAVGHTVLTYIR